MKQSYDLHLSAYSISRETIKKVEEIGFCRDEFANNTRCETTQYHGTFRGKLTLPNEKLWNQICQILSEDNNFSGGLEEEEFGKGDVIFFNNSVGQIPQLLPVMKTIQPPAYFYKACDIHISIDTTESNSNCVKYLEALELPSFDKPKNGNIYRIFSITCETISDGKQVFEFMSRYLASIPELKGKMKFERTNRFFRLPEDAVALPLTNSINLSDWFSNINVKCSKLQKNYSLVHQVML